MFAFKHWLRRLQTVVAGTALRPQPARRRHTALNLERLEYRVVPAPAELFELDPATLFGQAALSPDNHYLVIPTLDEKDRMARVYRFQFPP